MKALYLLLGLGLAACGSESFSLFDGEFQGACKETSTLTVTVSGESITRVLETFQDDDCTEKIYKLTGTYTFSVKGEVPDANTRLVEESLVSMTYVKYDDIVSGEICGETPTAGQEYTITDCEALMENIQNIFPLEYSAHMNSTVGATLTRLIGLDETRLCVGSEEALDTDTCIPAN